MSQQTLFKQAESYTEQGEQLQEQDRIDDAIASYKEAIRIRPNYPKPFHRLLAIYQSQEDWSELAKCARSLIAIQPDNYVCYLKLARALIEQNKIYGAIGAYKEAIELNSELPPGIYYQLGHLLVKEKNELEDAIDVYNKIPDINPNFLANLYVKLATKLQDEGELERAIAHHRKSVELAPDAAHRHRLLGDVLFEQQNYDEAIACYKQAIKLKPDFAAAYRKIGDACQKQGELDMALQCYRKALEVNPEAIYIYHLLGNVLTQQGRDEDARKCYALALN